MKTIHNVKYLLLGLFLVHCSIFNELKAQTETDAFYIYQNDGHFDGFFYDDIIKISYSRLDTLGVTVLRNSSVSPVASVTRTVTTMVRQ